MWKNCLPSISIVMLFPKIDLLAQVWKTEKLASLRQFLMSVLTNKIKDSFQKQAIMAVGEPRLKGERIIY